MTPIDHEARIRDEDDQRLRALFRDHEHLATPAAAQRAVVAASDGSSGAATKAGRRWWLPGLAAAAVLAMVVSAGMWSSRGPTSDHAARAATTSPETSRSAHLLGEAISISDRAPVGTREALLKTLDRYQSVLGPDVIAVLADRPLVLEGTWEPSFTEYANLDVRSLGYCGGLEWVGSEPAPASPSTQKVVGADGVAHQVTVLGALDALGIELVPSTADCYLRVRPLRLTSATPTHMDATVGLDVVAREVPAWRFTVEGSSVTLVVAAVSEEVLPVLRFPEVFDDGSYAHARINHVLVAPDGRTLTVEFDDVPTGDARCVETYVASYALDPRALALSIRDVLRSSPADGTCLELGTPWASQPGPQRTLELTLPEPLGPRVVLDSPRATPVAVTRTR